MALWMAAIVAPNSVDATIASLKAKGREAWVAGTIRDRTDSDTGDAEAKGGSGGSVNVVGEYAN